MSITGATGQPEDTGSRRTVEVEILTPDESVPTETLAWSGTIRGVQPRIRLLRSFDQRSHSYLGYVLLIRGTCGEDEKEFSVAVGKGAQAKHGFKVGLVISGVAVPVRDPRLETADLYKVSKLKVGGDTPAEESEPPYYGVPQTLEEYRARAHRRLDARTYQTRCSTCIWGCRMPVAMIIDHWNPSEKRYRFETFCYGPKSCSFYRAGKTRTVPGRKGMIWEEEDWVDEDDTAHRSPDD